MPEKDKDIFEEEFDKSDVVNSDEALEYPFDEFEKKDVINTKESDIEKAESIKEQLIDSEELSDIITRDEDAKRAINLINKVGEKKEANIGVIKKSDTNKYNIKETADPEDFMPRNKKNHFLDNSNLNEDEVDNLIKISDSKRRKLEFEAENDEINKSEEELLRENFQDYLLAKRLSGSQRSLQGNLLAADKVKDTGQIAEFTDNHGAFDSDHNTTVEINRNSEGELESIVVYCKCGEKTAINFEYEEEGELQTQIINEDTEVKPLQNVYNEEFRSDFEALSEGEDADDEIQHHSPLKFTSESLKDDETVDKITRNTKYKDFDNPEKEGL